MTPVFWGLVYSLPFFVFIIRLFLLLKEFNLFGSLEHQRKDLEDTSFKALFILFCYRFFLLSYLLSGFFRVFVHIFVIIFHPLFLFMAYYSSLNCKFERLTKESSFEGGLFVVFWIFLWRVSLSQSLIFFGFINPSTLILVRKLIGFGVLLYFFARWHENEEKESKKFK